MKNLKGLLLLILGVLGSVFVCFFDVIVGKPANDVGRFSIAALVVCAILIVIGVIGLVKQKR